MKLIECYEAKMRLEHCLLSCCSVMRRSIPFSMKNSWIEANVIVNWFRFDLKVFFLLLVLISQIRSRANDGYMKYCSVPKRMPLSKVFKSIKNATITLKIFTIKRGVCYYFDVNEYKSKLKCILSICWISMYIIAYRTSISSIKPRS